MYSFIGAWVISAVCKSIIISHVQIRKDGLKYMKRKERKPVPPSKGVIVCDGSLCAGCSNCLFACSLSHEGAANLELARIQLNAHTQAEFDICALPCNQCGEPECLYACPFEAIYVDEKTGARVIDQEKCVGCRSCVRACPLDPPRLRFHKAAKKVLKCDLCGGDPQCVKMCPTGALKYVTDPDGIKSGPEKKEG